ncbi:MAG: HNH endonuclease [Campylobacteraceae bacterium]|jgi:5-methylcytosine-specific restriction endonuclease McrA|nr:HNH endonuclease [Campylobacteraceae bacterium]
MPTLYKRCRCGAKILYTQKYCSECAKKYSYLQNKQYDSNVRDTALSKFYKSAQWKKIRERVLAKEPFCRICGRAAQVVDHIVEIKDGGSKLAYDNLQPLCHSCHNRKTNQQKEKRC